MITLVIADDRPLVRDALYGLLNNVDDITVVGTATDGREAVARAFPGTTRRRAEPREREVLALVPQGLPTN